MSSRPLDVAVIGGGVAGSALTIALASTAPAGYRLALFDRSEPGPGTAYAPQSPSLLMNGSVRAMSPVPDATHFARYLVDEHEDALVCRARYGAYMRATVSATLAARRDFSFVRGEVVDLEESDCGYTVALEDGRSFHARNVVLALGNFAPGETFLPAEVREFSGYARDPWRSDFSRIDDGDVALIGSRLTAMDVVALLDERAFRGRIHVISRHGLLPQIEHPRARGLNPALLALDDSSPYSLLRTLRRAAARHDGDWREIIESLRPTSPAIWTRWNDRERRRFLRHAQSMWAIHRYRVPAATHAAFVRLNEAGRIFNHRARIVGATVEGALLDLQLKHANGAFSLPVTKIVNCTGPESDIEGIDDRLVRAALRRGLIRPDALRLGVDANERLHVIDREGGESPHLFAMGPLLRGLWYETTAVPEIARHAGAIAGTLLAQREQLKEHVG